MSFDTAKRVLEPLKLSAFKLQLAGGEPLLNLKLIREIHSYMNREKIGAELCIQTNGCLITHEIAKELGKMGIAIGISLDGPPEVNDLLRGDTSGTLRGIRILGEQGIPVNINCVVTSKSVKFLPELVDIAFYMENVGGIGLDLLRFAGRAELPADFAAPAEPEEIRHYVRAAYERSIMLYKAFGRTVGIREIEEARRGLASGRACGAYCHAANGNSIVVLPDGSIYPCGSLWGRTEYCMGNVHGESPLRELRLKAGRPAECRGCAYRQVCRGACPSRILLNSGTDGFSEQDCALRKVSFELAQEAISTQTSYMDFSHAPLVEDPPGPPEKGGE